MKYAQFKSFVSKSLLLVAFYFAAFAGTAKAGLDYYSIYIGKKLVFTRAVNKTLSLENLPISETDMNEQLVIEYYQCNIPDKTGKNRSISLRDDNGNVIKQWKFADARDGNTKMTIPVKELMQVAKSSKAKSLSLYYAANGKTKDEQLAFISGGSKTVGRVFQRQLQPRFFAFTKEEDCLLLKMLS